MPRLTTVSGKLIELPPGRTYVFGRDPACDCVVQDRSCSRRHARITIGNDDGEAWLEDAGSRNGTFLSGQRVKECMRIPEGAQIRIGSTVFDFTFSDTDSTKLDPVELNTSETVFIESFGSSSRPEEWLAGDGSTIAGDISSLSLPELIQILAQMARTGTLRVDLPSGQSGHIDFQRGQPRNAECGDRRGFDAVLGLSRARNGRFEFIEREVSVPDEIGLPWKELLFDLCRALDESTTVEEAL